MVFGKGWLFSTGNGAEIRPLDTGRKSPDIIVNALPFRPSGVC